jgi:PhoH-like ATPase
MPAKKIQVLDTSVLLTDANAIQSFGNSDIVLPLKVLEEIDKHKKRQDTVGANARRVIRMLDSYRERKSLIKGVRIGRGKGILYVRGYSSSNVPILPQDLDPTVPDHIIIACALSEQQKNPEKTVIMVSNDINLRVIGDAVGLRCQDYNTVNQVVDDREKLYSGFVEHLVDEQIIDRFYSGEDIFLDQEDKKVRFYTNQYIMLVSSSNEKKTALCKFINTTTPLKAVLQHNDGVWGVRARNKEQAFALDMLMNPDIPIITLVGKAGSGKTLCAIAAGLAQSLESEDGPYRKLIVSRPVQPLGKDIGFLPGTMEEKMTPWLAPIQDNLQFLMGNDKLTLETYMEKGKIEIEALTYIRGRSISNAFMIIDEAQNLTVHELKTIITRVGENSKIILTGDIEQIDNMHIDETTNGLAYAVEKFKSHAIAGHITLRKGERSKVATLAAKIL